MYLVCLTDCLTDYLTDGLTDGRTDWFHFFFIILQLSTDFSLNLIVLIFGAAYKTIHTYIYI